jgi:hypothetical protein
MIYKGYRHCNISIGNVLFSGEPLRKQLFGNESKNAPTQDKIRKLVEKLEMDKECNGCIIDGDFAVILEKYFKSSRRHDDSSRSVCAIALFFFLKKKKKKS